jgi:O-antigen/teichoic acid export membrane protein
MVGGFGSVGVSAFALLAAGPRVLGTDRYSSLALAWTVVTIIGIGIAAPGEQTITRGLAAGGGNGVARTVAWRLLLVPGLCLVVLPLGMRVTGGDVPDARLWVATATVSALGWALLATVRGLLAGRHRFVAYSSTLFAEAGTRVVLVLCALLWPGQGALLLAAAVVMPLLASAALGWFMVQRYPEPRQAHLGAESRLEQGSITTVALLGQVCLSTAPLWLHWQSADAALAGAFVSATSYMRIPLLLAGGLYGPILAEAARQYARRSRAGVVDRTAVGFVVGVGGAGAAVLGLLLISGPALLLLYGGETGLSTVTLLWMGVTTMGSVASNILTQVLYGCERAPSTAVAWVPPAIVTTLLFAVAAGSAERMAQASAVGQLLATAALLALLPRSLPERPEVWTP